MENGTASKGYNQKTGKDGANPPVPSMTGASSSGDRTKGRAEMQGTAPPVPPQGGPSKPAAMNPQTVEMKYPGKMKGKDGKSYMKDKKDGKYKDGDGNDMKEDLVDPVEFAVASVADGGDVDAAIAALVGESEITINVSPSGVSPPVPPIGGPADPSTTDAGSMAAGDPITVYPTNEGELAKWLSDIPEQKYRVIGDMKVYRISENDYEISDYASGLSKAATIQALLALGRFAAAPMSTPAR